MTRTPPIDILDPADLHLDESRDTDTGEIIVRTAGQHGVKVSIEHSHVGPTVTQYLVTPGVGVAPRKVEGLTDALSVALGRTARYTGPVGHALGIEVPNLDRQTVRLRELFDDGPALAGLGIAVGRSVSGAVISAPLSKLPHLMVGGATGQGKSVFLNGVLISLLMKCTPKDLELIMIDPKRVELTAYASLPHLLMPIVTDPDAAAGVLATVASEMDFRFDRMSNAGVKNIGEWNDTHDSQRWARRVVVVDELADLMMIGGKDLEASIVRIAQLGRAAGIHLVLATQYPVATVITPMIKQNVPSRIAFTTADGTSSKVILGSTGAERLSGNGDALWSPVGALTPERVQTPFVTNGEIARVVAWWVKQSEPDRVAKATFDRLEASRVAAARATATTERAAALHRLEAETVQAHREIEDSPVSTPAPAPRDLDAEIKQALLDEINTTIEANKRVPERVEAVELALSEMVTMIEGLMLILEGK